MTELLDFLNRLSTSSMAKALPNKRIKGYPGGAASPYKAILLLVIFQKIRNLEPEFRDGLIRYANCVEGFDSLYRGLFGFESVDKLHEKIVQPFWNLGTGKPQLWKLIPKKDYEKELSDRILQRKQVKGLNIFSKLVDHAKLNPGDLALLRDEVANDAVRGFFITTHFQEQGSTAFDLLKRI
jgi:hypothetical protein